MTATTATKPDTKFVGLPKNKTGLFAADTIHEVKSSRNHLLNVPTLSPQFRTIGSANLLLASAEQNHHQLQQLYFSKNEVQHYYPADGSVSTNIDSSNDSRLTSNGIRNGFRPSTVRQQRSRLTTATAQRNNILREAKSSPPKTKLLTPQATAKLRSEIDHINNRLKHHVESSKSLRTPNNQNIDVGRASALSYSTSCRLSSASTIVTADRIHKRFSSAITGTVENKRPPLAHTANNTSNQTANVVDTIAGSTENVIDSNDHYPDGKSDDHQAAYAYRIPQQSNVGSECVFLTGAPIFTLPKSRPTKPEGHHNDSKSMACPFYVMYLTNLAMQQRQVKDINSMNNLNHSSKDNELTPLGMSSFFRKVPVNSRTSTANPKRQITRRQLTSPISINTYSTMDDDDFTTDSIPYTYNKRLSAKFSTFDNENIHSLKDVLRTSSWNHVQV